MKTLLLIITILLVGCQNKKDASDNGNLLLRNKVISEKVYDLDKHGNKKDLILLIEGNRMYTSNKNGDKIEFVLEKAGNKVYEINHKVINNIVTTEKGRIIYIFEGDSYWEYEKETKQKGNLVFVRKGNIIYQNTKKGLEKILIVA